MPTFTPAATPYVITDTLIRISLIVIPGGYFRTTSAIARAGVTRLANQDMYHVEPQPPGGLNIQISAGPLDPGHTFEQWLAEWLVINPSPEATPYELTLTAPQPDTW